MGVVWRECFCFGLFESEYEIAVEPVAIYANFVLNCNGFGGAGFGKRNHDLGEGGASLVACSEFELRWIGVDCVADLGASLDCQMFPCGFERTGPFGAVAIFTGFDAGDV